MRVKLFVGKQIHRGMLETATFENLRHLICATLSPCTHFSVHYEDEDKDLILVTATRDLTEAIAIQKCKLGTSDILKLIVTPLDSSNLKKESVSSFSPSSAPIATSPHLNNNRYLNVTSSANSFYSDEGDARIRAGSALETNFFDSDIAVDSVSPPPCIEDYAQTKLSNLLSNTYSSSVDHLSRYDNDNNDNNNNNNNNESRSLNSRDGGIAHSLNPYLTLPAMQTTGSYVPDYSNNVYLQPASQQQQQQQQQYQHQPQQQHYQHRQQQEQQFYQHQPQHQHSRFSMAANKSLDVFDTDTALEYYDPSASSLSRGSSQEIWLRETPIVEDIRDVRDVPFTSSSSASSSALIDVRELAPPNSHVTQQFVEDVERVIHHHGVHKLDLLRRVIENVIRHPHDMAFRCLPSASLRELRQYPGVLELLLNVGWEYDQLNDEVLLPMDTNVSQTRVLLQPFYGSETDNRKRPRSSSRDRREAIVFGRKEQSFSGTWSGIQDDEREQKPGGMQRQSS